MNPNIITLIIDGKHVEIDLNETTIKCAHNHTNTTLELCIEIKPNGELLPFAKIKLSEDYREVGREANDPLAELHNVMEQ